MIGKAKGRLVYVEPNDIPQAGLHLGNESNFDNFTWNPEDYNYSVDLQVIVPQITDTMRFMGGGSIETTFSGQDSRWISFFEGTNLNSNAKNDKEAQKYLTVSYSDISYRELEKNKVGNAETLGVTSIDITFNSQFFPQVTMKMCDVRASALMGTEEFDYYHNYAPEENGLEKTASNFFKAIFHFPYPRFMLSVKGNYGSKVTFMLAVNDFKSSLNSETGNFDVTITFIGYMYGLWTDIPMSYLLAAPYINKNSYASNENLKNQYWTNKVNEGIFRTFEGAELPTLLEFVDMFLDVQSNVDIQIGGSEETARWRELSACIKDIDELIDAFDEAYDTTPSREQCYITVPNGEYGEYGKFSFIMTDGVSGATNDFNSKFDSFVKKYAKEDAKIYNYFNGKTLENPLVSALSSDKRYVIFNVDGTFTDDFSKLMGEVNNPEDFQNKFKELISKDENGKITFRNESLEHYRAKGGFYVKRGDLTSVLESVKAELTDEAETQLRVINDNTTSLNEELLGFKPSVENIYRIIFAHMETFLQLLYNVISEVGKDRKIKDYSLDEDGLDISCGKNVNPILPPFFGYYQKKGEDRNVATFPGKLPGLTNIPEVTFINSLIKAILGTKQDLTKRIEKYEQEERERTESEGNDFKTPENVTETINMVDDKIYIPNSIYDINRERRNPYDFCKTELESLDVEPTKSSIVESFLWRLVCVKTVGTKIDKDFVDVEIKNFYSTAKNGTASLKEKITKMSYVLHNDIKEVLDKSGYKDKLREFYSANSNGTWKLTIKDNSASKVPKWIKSIKALSFDETLEDKYTFMPISGVFSDETKGKMTKESREIFFKYSCEPYKHFTFQPNGNGRIYYLGNGEREMHEKFSTYSKHTINDITYKTYDDFVKGIVSGKIKKEDCYFPGFFKEKYAPNSNRYPSWMEAWLKVTDDVNSEDYKKGLDTAIKSFIHFIGDGNKEYGMLIPSDILADDKSMLLTMPISWVIDITTEKENYTPKVKCDKKLELEIEDFKNKVKTFLVNLKTKEHCTEEIDGIKDCFDYEISQEFLDIYLNLISVAYFGDYYKGWWFDGEMDVEEATRRFINGIADKFKHPEEDTTEEPTSETANKEENSDPTFKSDDLKVVTYYNLKNLYYKWLVCYDRKNFLLRKPEDTLIIQRNRYNDTTSEYSEFDSFIYIDSYHQNIGNRFMINPLLLFKQIKDYCMGESDATSTFSFMNDVAANNKLLFLSLPIYNNFYNEGSIREIFTPNIHGGSPTRDFKLGNTYVLMYTHEVSKFLSANKSDDDLYFKDDGTDLAGTWTTDDEVDPDNLFSSGNDTEGVEFMVPSFGVTYGKQNQSYFKSIQVNMDNPISTDYSIANTFRLADTAKAGDVNYPIGRGQDMFSIFSNRTYMCTVEMMGCMNIMPMMYFQLNNVPMFKGAYMIYKVSHHITPGKIDTSFTGVRISKNKMPLITDVFDLQSLVDRISNLRDSVGNNVGGRKWSNDAVRIKTSGLTVAYTKDREDIPEDELYKGKYDANLSNLKPGISAGEILRDNRTGELIYPTSTENKASASAKIAKNKDGSDVQFNVTNMINFLSHPADLDGVVVTPNTNKDSMHVCATAVKKALEAAGFAYPTGSNGAYCYNHLAEMGFYVVGKVKTKEARLEFTRNKAHPGDIALMEHNTMGHICIYNGTNWVSDFCQNEIWVYNSEYRNSYQYIYIMRYAGEFVDIPDSLSSQFNR